MAAQQNILGLIDPRGQSGRAAMVWMKLLHQGAVGANYRFGISPRRQAQYLVRLLTRHRAAPAPPARVAVTLFCITPAGKPAVEICL